MYSPTPKVCAGSISSGLGISPRAAWDAAWAWDARRVPRGGTHAKTLHTVLVLPPSPLCVRNRGVNSTRKRVNAASALVVATLRQGAKPVPSARRHRLASCLRVSPAGSCRPRRTPPTDLSCASHRAYCRCDVLCAAPAPADATRPCPTTWTEKCHPRTSSTRRSITMTTSSTGGLHCSSRKIAARPPAAFDRLARAGAANLCLTMQVVCAQARNPAEARLEERAKGPPAL